MAGESINLSGLLTMADIHHLITIQKETLDNTEGTREAAAEIEIGVGLREPM